MSTELLRAVSVEIQTKRKKLPNVRAAGAVDKSMKNQSPSLCSRQEDRLEHEAICKRRILELHSEK